MFSKLRSCAEEIATFKAEKSKFYDQRDSFKMHTPNNRFRADNRNFTPNCFTCQDTRLSKLIKRNPVIKEW